MCPKWTDHQQRTQTNNVERSQAIQHVSVSFPLQHMMWIEQCRYHPDSANSHFAGGRWLTQAFSHPQTWYAIAQATSIIHILKQPSLTAAAMGPTNNARACCCMLQHTAACFNSLVEDYEIPQKAAEVQTSTLDP